MKNILMTFLPLVVIILLSVVLAKFGLGKVLELRSRVSQARKNETILSQKLNLLDEVQDTVSQASFTSSALPEKNSSIIAISQAKILAGSSGLVLSGIKAGDTAEDKSGLGRTDINFDVEGARAAIFEFLRAVEASAPIVKIEKVKLAETGGVSRASVTVRSYFAALPTKLPTITEAINDLTGEERGILTDVLGLTQPAFVDLSPSQEAGRDDPFSP